MSAAYLVHIDTARNIARYCTMSVQTPCLAQAHWCAGGAVWGAAARSGRPYPTRPRPPDGAGKKASGQGQAWLRGVRRTADAATGH